MLKILEVKKLNKFLHWHVCLEFAWMIILTFQENHKFLWSIEDEAKLKDSWEARMAKKYYDKLFKGISFFV